MQNQQTDYFQLIYRLLLGVVGTIFICISNGEKTVISDHKMNGNRAEILERAGNKAQWELIKFIKNLY